MKRISVRFTCLVSVFLILIGQSLLSQDLRSVLNNIFTETLGNLVLDTGAGTHGDHFLVSNVEASALTIDAFSNFVSANISSFPLSSTVAGQTFDFSGGVPTSTTNSLGPIFTERAQTLGRGRLNIGVSFNYLDFTKLRGTNVDDIQFTFTHEDVNNSGVIGDDANGNEFDTITLLLNTRFKASIFTFNANFGITNHFDIGVAVPFIALNMDGTPSAQVTPRTSLSRGDTASHHYGTLENPSLSFTPTPVSQSAAGIGDIAIRAKYHFVRGRDVDFAALVEFRPATGKEEDFLGSGSSSFKGQLIFSSITGDFSPHLNIAYEQRGSDLDRNEIELYAGWDQKVNDVLTLAVDFLGEFELGDEIAELRFPEVQDIRGANSAQFGDFTYFYEQVRLTNIANRSSDNIMNAAIGFKLNPKPNLLILGNVFIPVNDGGLRSDITPTLGFEFTL